MSDKYCNNCIHSFECSCILAESMNSYCKENDLFFWFPNLSDKDKVKTITETLKGSFNISELEAPHNNGKKKILSELNEFLRSNKKFKVKESNGHS